MTVIFECIGKGKYNKKRWLVYTKGYRKNSFHYELTQRGLERFVEVENRNSDVTIYDPYGDSV
jgi:hypothetical protein